MNYMTTDIVSSVQPTHFTISTVATGCAVLL